MLTLSFKSVSSGQFLDGRAPDGSDLRLASGERNPATEAYLQWVVGDAGNGHIFIKSVSSGQYLDGRDPGMFEPLLSSGGRNPATDAFLQWVVGDAENGHIFIKSVSSRQYLDGRHPGVQDPILTSGGRYPSTDMYLQWDIDDTSGATSTGCVRQLLLQGLNKIARVAPVIECQLPTLSFKSVSSGQFLDGRAPDGSDLRLASGERNPATEAYLQWVVGDAGNGHIFIKSVSSGQYLDGRDPGMFEPLLSSGGRNPATDAFLQWVVGDAENGHIFIKSVSSRQYLDGRHPGVQDPILTSGGRYPSTDMYLQWDIDDTSGATSTGCVRQLLLQGLNKIARVAPVIECQLPTLSFKSVSSGQFLDGRAPDGSDLQLASGERNPATEAYLQWVVGDAGNGHIFIKSVSSGQYLDGRDPGMFEPLLSSGGRNPATDAFLQWVVGDAENGHIFIKSVSSRQYLDGRHPGVQDPILSSGGRNPTLAACLQWTIKSLDSDSLAALKWSARCGHMGLVRLLVKHVAAVDICDDDGRTLLMWTASGGHSDIVRFLVEHGAAVDASSNDGSTPLMCAAIGGHLDVVHVLMEHGATVDARDNDDRTPLMRAGGGGHSDMVRFLVEHGAAVDASSSDGLTALLRAAGGGHLDVVRYLVGQGAAVGTRDGDGLTPLMCAAINGHLGVVRYLVEQGAPVDGQKHINETPLMWATKHDHSDVVHFLVEHGATVNAHSSYSSTPLMYAAINGHLDLVHVLVEHGAALDAHDSEGRTAFMRAVCDCRLDMMRYLVEQGATLDAHDNNKVTPLMKSARDGHSDIVRFLVEHGAAVDASSNDGSTPLMCAAIGGHLDVVHVLMEHGATVDARDNDDRTPLVHATISGHLDMVQIIVEHGAALDAHDSEGRTALMRAVCDCRLDMMRYLVEQGATLDAHDNNKVTPLMKSARDGHSDIVRFLVEHGAAVDASSNDGSTPLMCAAIGGHLDVVHVLMEHGATVDARDNDDRTPLMRAGGGGHSDMVRFLVEHGAAVDASSSDGLTALLRAAGGGHLDVVRYLVKQGAPVDTRDNDDRTPLMRAAGAGRLDVVRFLVEHGATLDASSSGGLTPLMNSARGGHLDVVRYLVDHGAAVGIRDGDGLTPLMCAAIGGHLGVVRYLVEHGATVDAGNNDNETPLMWATKHGHLNVVHFLVEHGATVDACNCEGVTPLMYSAHGGHSDVVCFLVEHGANVDAHNSHGATPLIYSVRGGHLDVVRILVEHSVAVDASDSNGWTPFMIAARDGHLDMVLFLVEHGAAVNVCSNDKWTPLMLAACDGHLDVVRIFVEQGTAVDVRGYDGWTPLMWAAKHGHIDVVRYLVEHEADVNSISETGDTTISSAAQFGHQEVVQYLLPLVRYHHQSTQMEHLDENVAQHSNIPSSWLISPFEVEVQPYDDTGSIGGDFRGKWLDADVVIKLFVDDATSATFFDEVRLWHQLRHPNVLKLYGVCNAEHKLFVCEYASNGSLPEYLKSCDAEHRTPWKFLYEAALGLEYLHERKIVHGNLHGSNILIGSDGLAKLSGFGLSASSPKGSWSKSGSWVRWASPEALRSDRVSIASDVYSLGMCVVEAVSGNIPFNKWNETDARYAVKYEGTGMNYLKNQLAILTEEQRELVLVMCRDEPRERLQVPVVVNKLERLAEVESTSLTQHSANPDPEPLMQFNAFDELKFGKTSDFWTAVQTLIAESETNLYRQMWHELELIYDTLRAQSHPWSTLQRFHDLLDECRLALDTMSKQNQVRRLSATRARDHSVQGLHRRITQLLQLVRPQDHDADTHETEWKQVCREQAEVFVSETSEACVMLSSVDSEEDRSALVAVLRAELRNSDGKYTGKQLEVLQKAHDDVVSKSLEDVHLATTPEWFIPWFELEMNEMKTLGEGGFGSVIKAKWLDSEVVVKKLEISPKDAANDDKKREMRQMFEREVDIWFGLSHPHVVRLFGACHVGRPFFVCELAPNGTLVDYLGDHPDELWSKLREAALGVQYLHARGIVHGDLKGNNILIGSDGKAKVTDFGLSGVFGDDSTEMVVSEAMHWVAPECMLKQKQKPTFASDIYSLGMCIIEVLRVTNGDEDDLPWGRLPNAAVKFNVTRRHLLPPRPKNCSDEAWTLIERMCKSAPTDRMLIMTVVDELEKLAGQHNNLTGETDQIDSDIDKARLLSFSVVDELAEMKNWIVQRDANKDWEMNVLMKIYQLLWDRLEQVAKQLSLDSDITDDTKTTISDFAAVVERSHMQTREALDITDGFPLAKFTEMALGAYTSHRRLDKFLAAHTVSNGSSSLHNWTSACSTLMGVSASLPPAAFEEEYSVVNVATSFIQFVYRDRSKPIQNLTYESSLLSERVQEAREEIDGYFIKQGELPDVCGQQEIARVFETWLEKSKAQVSIATESALDHLPQTFSTSNSAQLSSVLEAFHQAVKQTLQACTEECKSSITAILEKRQGLVVASFLEIQQILTTFGIVLPAEMKPKFSPVAVKTESKHDLLSESNAWLAKMVDLMQIQLAQDVRQVVRVKVEAGSVYDAEHDFAGETTSDNVEIDGRFIHGDSYAKLGPRMDLQMSCQIGSAYAGQSFVLELSHLTSDAGPGARAPVTVRVNGHSIRENFCPRAMHERNGNKVGVWWYETDRWHVSSSFIHEGENIVSVSYGDHGTAYYWIRSLGLHCALPRMSTAEIHTRDVKKFFDTAMTSRMQHGQDQKLLLERVLLETSPMLEFKAMCKQYIGSGQIGRYA